MPHTRDSMYSSPNQLTVQDVGWTTWRGWKVDLTASYLQGVRSARPRAGPGRGRGSSRRPELTLPTPRIRLLPYLGTQFAITIQVIF